MPNVAEETGRPSIDMLARPSLGPTLAVPQSDTEGTSTPGLGRRLSNAMRFPSFRPSTMAEDQPPSKEEQYEEDLVDVLDTIGMSRMLQRLDNANKNKIPKFQHLIHSTMFRILFLSQI